MDASGDDAQTLRSVGRDPGALAEFVGADIGRSRWTSVAIPVERSIGKWRRDLVQERRSRRLEMQITRATAFKRTDIAR